MDHRRNWILLDASTSQPNAPIMIRDRRFRATPSQTREEERIYNINQLNDRIQKKVANSYVLEDMTGTGRKGERIVDESFRFIDDEQQGRHNTTPVPPDKNELDSGLQSASDRLDSLISCRNSHGEVEAIFERRQRPLDELATARNDPYHDRNFTRNYTSEIPEPIYVQHIPYESKRHDTSREYGSTLFPEYGEYDNGISREWYAARRRPYYDHRSHRRCDSVDSGSVRLNRRFGPAPYQHQWKSRAISQDYLWDNTYGYNYPARHENPRLAAHTLRREPDFYDKCDLCAFKIFRSGDYCPACGRVSSVMRSLSNRIPSYFIPKEQILSARRLHRNTSPYTPRNRSRSYSTHDITIRPKSPRRPAKSPVYRYGVSVPESLYDYEAWARKADRRRMQKRAAGLALALLAVALIVSAGVVLAAVNN
ncbi:unnamed protein product [Auanema sp. JU1783]|nr:unnamed protein product [Auanema sp. JU1783]